MHYWPIDGMQMGVPALEGTAHVNGVAQRMWSRRPSGTRATAAILNGHSTRHTARGFAWGAMER